MKNKNYRNYIINEKPALVHVGCENEIPKVVYKRSKKTKEVLFYGEIFKGGYKSA